MAKASRVTLNLKPSGAPPPPMAPPVPQYNPPMVPQAPHPPMAPAYTPQMAPQMVSRQAPQAPAGPQMVAHSSRQAPAGPQMSQHASRQAPAGPQMSTYYAPQTAPGLPQAGSSFAVSQQQQRAVLTPPTVVGSMSAELAALNLTQPQLNAYRKKFNALDLNKDGIVTMREFATISKVFGYTLTSEEIMNIFGKRDLDSSGGIAFDEFVVAMQRRAKQQKDQFHVKEKLKIYDQKGRGYITSDEAYPVLHRLLGFDQNKTETLVDLFDKNRDYRLSMLEFVEFQKRVEELTAEVEQKFGEFDRNQDGYVDLQELSAALSARQFTPDQIQALMRKYDKDQDGKLNQQEFAEFYDIRIV